MAAVIPGIGMVPVFDIRIMSFKEGEAFRSCSPPGMSIWTTSLSILVDKGKRQGINQ